MGLPENLKRLQELNGETNYKLAKSIGASQTSIQNWKDGKVLPHKLYVKALADHFGVTINELITEEVQP